MELKRQIHLQQPGNILGPHPNKQHTKSDSYETPASFTHDHPGTEMSLENLTQHF